MLTTKDELSSKTEEGTVRVVSNEEELATSK